MIIYCRIDQIHTQILDYLEHKPKHQEFARAIGHLRLIQREAVASEPLKTRRALGSMV